jgi:2-amino-4-hydroxy-6-hydroxymethyldihydropteridine diphosphokinase
VSFREGYLGLGSNLGEPLEHLRSAVTTLGEHDVFVGRLSSVYRTEPVESPGSPWFLNAVAAVRFRGEPLDLLQACHQIEASRGRARTRTRARTEVNAPRTLDLDVLLVGSEIVTTPELTVPHPCLSARRFVLVPMVEIAPDVVNPLSGLTMRQQLSQCPDVSQVEVVYGPAMLASCA